MVDNDEWLGPSSAISSCCGTSGRISLINRMLTFDSVKLRLEREQPLTFLEFNYMILQAYDFRELVVAAPWLPLADGRVGPVGQYRQRDRADAADGRDRSIRRSPRRCSPPPSGAKMGKTASGAVWLNADQLPAYDYWQFWRRTADDDVKRFLKLFTDVSLDQITALTDSDGVSLNQAKTVLATEATTLLHGRSAAEKAASAAVDVFSQGGISDSLPSYQLNKPSISLVEALASISLCASKAEARRLIRQGGARINGEKILDENYIIFVNVPVRISAGRKAHGVLLPML